MDFGSGVGAVGYEGRGRGGSPARASRTQAACVSTSAPTPRWTPLRRRLRPPARPLRPQARELRRVARAARAVEQVSMIGTWQRRNVANFGRHLGRRICTHGVGDGLGIGADDGADVPGHEHARGKAWRRSVRAGSAKPRSVARVRKPPRSRTPRASPRNSSGQRFALPARIVFRSARVVDCGPMQHEDAGASAAGCGRRPRPLTQPGRLRVPGRPVRPQARDLRRVGAGSAGGSGASTSMAPLPPCGGGGLAREREPGGGVRRGQAHSSRDCRAAAATHTTFEGQRSTPGIPPSGSGLRPESASPTRGEGSRASCRQGAAGG